MSDKRAETVAEAQSQTFTIPEFADWRGFAGLINGYKIAEELGLDFPKWGTEQKERWETSNQWDLDLLHLRIMLFYTYRADYMTGWDYTEHNEMADSLLQVISEITGQPYEPLSDPDV